MIEVCLVKSIRLKNFQCFKDSTEIPIHKITILIGENDSGKSSIFKALDFFFNNKPITSDVFHKINNIPENNCEIQIIFDSLHKDFNDFPIEFVVDDQVTIKKIFNLSESGLIEQKSFILRYLFETEPLNDIFSLKSPELKKILLELDLNYTTVEESRNLLNTYVKENFNNLPKRIDWALINWPQISNFVPNFEIYNSSSMSTPTKQIENTLRSIFRTFFYDIDETTGLETEKQEFKDKRKEIVENLNKKIKDELKEKIQANNKKIQGVTGNFNIDFAGGFSLNTLLADFGQGERDINSIGEGSKKRLFLAIMEWEREIRSKQKFKKIVRAYDEPDTSLHYRAQKEMFYSLKSVSEQDEVKIQPILSTHSLSMIDRAPPRIINHVVVNNGISHVEHLLGDESAEIKDYLDKVSEISGLSNSSIFFERCFLIVEGDTEEYALPILYKKMTGKTLSEDGVVLQNLGTNSTWKSYLKLLSKNKKDATILFLDKDIQDDGKKRITRPAIREVGFEDPFFDNNVILVGTKEFEDIFTNESICACLNQNYPKIAGEVWCCEEIQNQRLESKFSKALKDMVEKYQHDNGIRNRDFRKPEFGVRLGQQITDLDLQQIPDLIRLIEKIGQIIV